MLFLKFILALFGFFLLLHRNKFRRLIYRTNNLAINIRPFNGKEIKALLGNIYPYDSDYIRNRNIYRLYISVFFALLITVQVSANHSSKNNSATMKKIEIGDKIPAFKLNDQNGNTFDVNSVLGNKNLVIFFYPKDDTPGCTKEACAFRDQYEAFTEADAEVIGISGQSVESHKNFAEKHDLHYSILSDQGNALRKQFGVPTNFFGLMPGRVTYVVNKAGKVVHIFNSQTNISGHVDETLKILNELN